MNNPLVSIITAVYNGEKYLEKTILSVLGQSYENIEYIIIDGASTDGTLEIIKKYEEQIDYWISEEDNGVYEAMNKGLKVAKGQYIAILNADDYYTSNAMALSITKIIETKSHYSIANVKYVNSQAMIRAIYPLREHYVYQEMPYPHVSTVISSKIYNDVGFFDTSLKIAGDHDMAVRIHLKGYKACYVDEVIAELEEGGISSGVESNKESLLVAIKNGKSTMNAWITYINQRFKILMVNLLPPFLVKGLKTLKGSRFR